MRKSTLGIFVGCIIFALMQVPPVLAQDDSSSSSTATTSTSTTSVPDASVTPTSDPQASAVTTTPGDDTTPSLAKRLGTPFAFSIQPNGTKMGPFTITDVSSNGFYVYATAPREPSQTFWGSTTSSDILWNKNTDRNTWAFQTTPSVSVASGSAYLNEEASLAFTRQLTERWSLSATNQFSYLQNSFLLDPQNVLAYGAGGFYYQTLYTQQRGAATYNSNNLSMTYLASGRTQISITPQVGFTFMDQYGSMDFITYLGGGLTVNHNRSATQSVFFNYNYTYSKGSLSSVGYDTGWNTNTFGVGFRQQLKQFWWVTGNISASYQSGPNSYWLPVGNIGVMRSLHNGSFSVGYSRSQAQQVLLSSGYFDQADLAYTHSFGRKISASLGAAAFRTIQTTSHGQGQRYFGSFYYRWVHNLSWVASYNYSNQTGNQPLLNIGTTTYVSFGLRWFLGQVPRQ